MKKSIKIKLKTFLIFSMVAVVMSTMLLNVKAYDEVEIIRNSYDEKDILHRANNQTKAAYSYLADNYAPEDWCFNVSISGGTAWWRNRIRDGMDNWYNTSTGVIIEEDSSSRNEANVVSVSDTWYGLYAPYVYTTSRDFSRFIIQINTNRLPSDNSKFVQSTTTHELGHAVHLADNPLPNNANGSLMNHSRNRNTIYTPTSYDQDAVNNYYGYSRSSKGSIEISDDEMGTLVADYIEYTNAKDLINDADLIIKCNVLGKPIEQFLEVGSDMELPYTISTVEVLEIYKGEAQKGDMLEIKQLGGEKVKVNKAQYITDGEYLLFLESYNNSPYSMLNPVQAQYLVEDNQFSSMEDNNIIIKNKMLDNM